MDLSYLKEKTFLIIDDDKFNIQLIGTMLKKIADVNIISTDKGSEALSLLKTWAGKVDVVLLDLHMPEMEGNEVLRVIREELELEIPVLIISVDGLNEQELLAAGANDFVLKPFDLEDLKNKIAKHMPEEV